jgi:hypothetical protein
MTTELYQAYKKADAAFEASSTNLDLCNISNETFTAYMQAVGAARKEWEAITGSAAKDSAENNAFDTEGAVEDELYWFEIALSTYKMNIDCGYYNTDGSAK